MSLPGQVAAALIDAFRPLAAVTANPMLANGLFAGLGIDVELDEDAVRHLADAIPSVGRIEGELIPIAERLAAGQALTAGDAVKVVEIVDAVRGDLTDLTVPASADRLAPLPAPLDDPATWQALAGAIPDALVASWIEAVLPALYLPLRLAGVARGWLDGAGREHREVGWARLGDLLRDPLDAIGTEYGWGGDLDHVGLLAAARDVANALGLSVTWADPPSSLVAEHFADGVPYGLRTLVARAVPTAAVIGQMGDVGLGLVPIPAAPGGPIAGLAIVDRSTLAGGAVSEIAPDWRLELSGDADASGAVTVELLPGEAPRATGGPPTLDLGVVLSGEPGIPWLLVGAPDGLRLTLGGIRLEATVTGQADALELTASASMTAGGLSLVLPGGSGDAFVSEMLGDGVEAGVAFELAWSSDGLTLGGIAALTATIPIDRTLGAIRLEQLEVALQLGEVSELVLGLSASFTLGPIEARIQGVGLRLVATVDPAGDGLLGPFALDLAFEPPDGVGLVLDAGVATGGGYLDLEPEIGRYSGVLELELFGVGICAVAIIDTEALGSGEWSMFFALFIDLPAIQLGFGFALTGVGGLAGINRTLEREALEAAVRSGSLDTVLFPDDPVADAPQVIAELSAIFPPSPGRTVFGPVVRLAWGTPPLIEAVLGIVLSLPDPVTVAVMGSVTSVLPTADVDLVALHLDVGGGIDTAAGALWIDAALHDSHIVGFALNGGMAVRSDFVDQPSFLMALGGFHPGFEAPGDFPDLLPLSLSISAAPVLDIGFQCYLAITSNSVQFGAAFHLSAKVAGFGIEGGASFDALVEFSPFRLATRLGWYVAITAAGVDLAGVWLDASVEGPNPWLVVGTARFKILGLESHVQIDERIGAEQPEPAVPPADLLVELAAALADEGAWSATAGTSPGVVATSAPGPDELVVMPDGVIGVSQRAVPLGLRLDKAGDAPLGDHDTFTLEPGAASLTSTGTLRDWFAPGHFFELGAGERLSSPSFERLQSGIEFGGGEPVAGRPRPGTLDFEEILRDPELGEDGISLGTVDLVKDPRELILTASAGGQVVGGRFQIAADPGRVALAPSAFAVVQRDTGAVQVRAGTWSAAHQSDAGRRAATTLVPSWEAPP